MQAILGGAIRAPGIHGEVELKVSEIRCSVTAVLSLCLTYSGGVKMDLSFNTMSQREVLKVIWILLKCELYHHASQERTTKRVNSI